MNVADRIGGMIRTCLIAALGVGCSFEAVSTHGGTGVTSADGAVSPVPRGTGSSTSGTTGGTSNADAAVNRCDWTADPDRRNCVGQLYQSQGLPLDIYVMFDESGSMATKDDGVTMRIDAVRAALGQFLGDPNSAGLSVGIGYFGTQPLMCACTSCNPNDYATPAVAISALPAAAPGLVASLATQAPTGETPTGAALRGACLYGNSAKRAQPGHAVVILLVTDGIPQAPLTSQAGGCNPTLAEATAAAAECLGGAAPIRTYVLGVGPSLANLNQIAAAGGTGHAYLVENGGAAGVLTALGAIRQDAMIPCSLALPKSPNGFEPVDLTTTNVVYADGSCKFTTFVNVKTPAGCDPQRGGWYYDDPSHPGSIELCDASCTTVAAPGGELRVSLGCTTITIP